MYLVESGMVVVVGFGVWECGGIGDLWVEGRLDVRIFEEKSKQDLYIRDLRERHKETMKM